MADKNINSSPEAVTVDKDDYLFLSKDGTNLNKVLISKVLALVDLSTYAPKASPSFSGTPTAPNPIYSSNSQQIATTKWVRDLLGNVSTSIPAATSTALGGIKAEAVDDSYTVEVKIDQATSRLFVPTYPTGAGGTSSYSALSDKPQINGITLTAGNNTLSNLGIQPAGNYLTSVPKATSSVYGGIKASEKGTGDTVEVKQDNSSGKLYVPTYPSLSGYALLNAPTFSNPKTNAPASSSNDTSIPNTQWVRTLVDNKLVPVGGLAGQALVKSSGSDYDVEWATISGGSGGTTNYNALSNRPSINDVTLEGSMTAADLGIYSVPTGGTTGQVLKKTSSAADGYAWADESGGADVDLSDYATLASPAFTGTPTAPTQNTTDNSTKIATTAYVKNNLGNYAPITSPSLKGTPTSVTPVSSASGNQIANVTWVRNYGVAKNQGSSNSGKFLSVGSDGQVQLSDAPSGSGGSSSGGGSSGGGEWAEQEISLTGTNQVFTYELDGITEFYVEGLVRSKENAGYYNVQINGKTVLQLLLPASSNQTLYSRGWGWYDGKVWRVGRTGGTNNASSS